MSKIDTGAWAWTDTTLNIEYVPGDATITSCKTLRINVFPDDIVDVIYNPPATVIHWSDKTKTVVKCSADDEYDPLTGFLLCVTKRAFGNENEYKKVLKKWCNPVETTEKVAKNALKKQARTTKRETVCETCSKHRCDAAGAELYDGDKVVMYQHIDVNNIEFEPPIGAEGVVLTIGEDGQSCMVAWPDGTVREDFEPYKDERYRYAWWLPCQSVRKVDK